ncbi:phage tail protein [Vibrio rotiferianus]|uniref:phage tail protein n=1 Tax=Vibrio rotiferianus TaxID=190895 RepID=UPI0011107CF4|nr:phage tail protein [Vibrio rotiferianus]TMX39763.1 phage tail protein [Vibrio rotiferianus]TMX57840.1 phage tail protein [Vibrio rotiferianus]TMX59161.1 phage tail protein [Vibrio rotiferianus]
MTERSDHAPELSKTPTPWWQDGSTTSEALKEPYFVSNGAFGYMTKIREWLLFPLKQVDPMTCSEKVLNLMAWDANITRFSGETETIFRKRVKYAFQNAKDAGCKQGFANIFNRMGVQVLAQNERLPDRDWDIISLELGESEIASDVLLLQALIQQYGRTCRRYEFSITSECHPVYLAAAEFNCEWQNYSAYMDIEYSVDDVILINNKPSEFNNQSQTTKAIWER